MKKLLSVIAILTCISILFAVVSCTATNDPATDTVPETTEKSADATVDDTADETADESESETVEESESETEAIIDPSTLIEKYYYFPVHIDKYFKSYGRMMPTKGGITCDYTASGIEFSGVMYGEVKIKLECTADTYFTVFIDGVRSSTRFNVGAETKELVIASFEEAGVHNIRFLKQSEAQRSLSVLKMVTVTGYLNEAPADKPHYIQVIGDSISCGYGNLTTNGTPNGDSALYEDGTQAFPFLTAEALGADVEVLGCSGVGIDQGWTSFNEMTFYTTESLYRDRLEYTNVKHDFTKDRAPDLVIINLGTNDAGRGSTEAVFKANVKALVKLIRDTYGYDTPILWTYGMMGAGCADWVRATFEELGGEAKGFYMVELLRDNNGGGGHPTAQAHKAATITLTNYIKAKNILA